MIPDKQPHGQLRDLSPEKIIRNPENPRLFFRPEEMDTLMASIRRYGIQVPLTVYEEDDEYVLIDGERRWRCALKLNLKRVPALVQPKPTELNNLLLMFNIHALREQWDYLTIANKLPNVIELFTSENGGRAPNETELSEITGLTRGQIRRCRLLFDLPSEYRKLLEEELSLPKHLQRLSEDFFIEMERALKTVQKRVPTAIPSMNEARDALISKFRDGTINNITDFRKLSKIATSISNVGVRENKAQKAISDIFDLRKKISIHDVWTEQFEMRYDERKIKLSIDSVYEYLDATLESEDHVIIGDDLKDQLNKLKDIIDRILEDTNGV
ncbi:ParB family chromosome partitioning protein [Agrobacterium pusense]|uniref:ParB/RepB/Spo0J family partition protein n=1 Tax=Agrobacterium pusense TaxID=648995 RepID=UPI00285C4866|nr:ParB/RepB/Spo0J family partition protein [Agrobacterium pusense]MDR6189193.1 ParB family chromosome partitioning protein [Agrobacterium pusense]